MRFARIQKEMDMTEPVLTEPALQANEVLAQAVALEFAQRPIVITAVLKHFSAALARRFPAQRINVLTTTLNLPAWEADDERDNSVHAVEIEGAGHTTVPLLEVMIHSITGKASLHFTAGHFLSDVNGQRLQVDMPEVEDLLRAIPKVLPALLQQALTDFWSDTLTRYTRRWQWFADICKAALVLNLTPASDLDHEQILTLRQIAHCPEKAERQRAYGADCAEAWLMSYSATSGEAAHTGHDILVTRRVGARQIVLCFDPAGNVAAFDTLQAVTDRYGGVGTAINVDIQLWSITADVFVTQVQAVLDAQLGKLAQWGDAGGHDLADLEAQFAAIGDTGALFYVASDLAVPSGVFGAVANNQPLWLSLASSVQLLDCSQRLLALAALHLATEGRSYDDGIDSAATFARHALIGAMAPFGTGFDPDALLVTQTRYQADAFGVATGTAIVETTTLTQRALMNLGGLVHAKTTWRLRDDSVLPAWVSEDSLRSLITDADIGAGYTEMVKRELLDDPVKRLWRERRFAEHLRVQLPLLALESHITGRGALTEAGYRQVDALMQVQIIDRKVDAQPIVIRPLAFVLDAAERVDVVSNMFVIGPQSVDAGPHVLYRPLYSPPLMQFSSLPALLAAICADTSLQKSVLDWLEPDARSIYANGGFEEPHLATVIIDVDFPVRPAPAAPVISELPVVGDPLMELYRANAHFLLQKADEQTVSNAEYRWSVLLGLGVHVFDALLGLIMPYLRGSTAAAGWLMTLELDALRSLTALGSGEVDPGRQLLVSLMAQLAVALLAHRLAERDIALPGTPVRAARTPHASSIGHVLTTTASVEEALDTVVDFSVAPPRDSRTRLERYLSLHPQGVGPRIDTAAFPGIHVVDGRWYAKVPGRIAGWGWAQVTPVEAPDVVMLDHTGQPIKWLQLRYNGNDQWDTAPEFRVRHGGRAASRLRNFVSGDPQLNAARAARANKLERLKAKRAELDVQIIKVRESGNAAILAFHNASAGFDELQARIDGTQGREQAQLKREMQALQQRLRILDPQIHKAGASYAELQLKYITELDKVRPILDADEHYLREDRIHYLEDKLARLFVIENALENVSDTMPQLGFGKEQVFPLVYDGAASANDVPYNALFEARKRILKFYPTRIEVSQALEDTAEELVKVDEVVSKGRRSASFIQGFTARALNTDDYKVFELMSIQGALTGNPAHSPSMLEAAAIEGLSRIPLGRVTGHLLELDSTYGFTPNERILLLQDAVAHYANAEALAHCLERHAGATSFVPEEFVSRFLDRLKPYRFKAEQELERVARAEVTQTEPQEPAADVRPRAKRTRNKTRRVIETADGMVMGSSSDELDDPDETVISVDPYTGTRTTYYRHVDADPAYQARRVASPVPPRPIPGLGKLLKDGHSLLKGVEGFRIRVAQAANISIEPKSQEDMLVSQALKLEETADQLQRRRHEYSTEQQESVSRLAQALSASGQSLRDQAVQLRIDGARRLPPTVGNLQYLLDHREVRIGNWSWSDRTTLAGGADFLLEFEVLDEKALANQRHRVLWYAHFHCAKKNATTLKKGHLKLASLRYKTYADQVREAQANQVKAIESANINAKVAEKLFFMHLPAEERSR